LNFGLICQLWVFKKHIKIHYDICLLTVLIWLIVDLLYLMSQLNSIDKKKHPLHGGFKIKWCSKPFFVTLFKKRTGQEKGFAT